jgi:hypothetical protein
MTRALAKALKRSGTPIVTVQSLASSIASRFFFLHYDFVLFISTWPPSWHLGTRFCVFFILFFIFIVFYLVLLSEKVRGRYVI